MERQRQRPVSACTTCGAPGYEDTHTEQGRCRRTDCNGSVKRAIGINEWAECQSCEATGWDDDNTCTECDGYGWLFVRLKVLRLN